MANGSLLSTKELSSYLGVSLSNVYRLVENDEIPYKKRSGLGIKFRKDEVDEWLERSSHKPNLYSSQLINNHPFELTDLPRSPIYTVGGEISGMARAKSKTRYNFTYGAIYQRKYESGKIRWFLDYKDSNGKRVQRVASHAVTAKEANIELKNAVLKEHHKKCGLEEKRQKISFKEFSDLFLENYSKPNKKSWECDYYSLEAHLKPYFGKYELEEISPLMIEKFRAEKLKEGLGKSSTNRLIALLKRMYSMAMVWSFAGTNPAKEVKLFSEKDNLKERILSEKEEELLLAECADHLKPIVITALSTGMRKNEILTLTWNHVDFKQGFIQVVKTKSGKNREIPINDDLLALLEELKRNRKSEYVFANPETGKPFRTIRHSFENACRRANIQNLRFQDLRHTFASRLIQKGADIVTVQNLLGHHSVLITQRYTHTNSKQKREAVQLLNQNHQKSTEKEDFLLHICVC